MRYPTLHHSLRSLQYIVPSAVKTIVDIGVQRKTDFLMDVYPDLNHHLFEPVAQYHEDLIANYQNAGIDFVLHKVALSNTDGVLYLHNTSGDGSGRVTHSQVLTEKDPELPRLLDIREIESARLDSVDFGGGLDDLSYLIKMDVDGVEELIIEGGHQVISGASLIVIEASLGRQDLFSRTALLEALGFRLFDICDHAYYFSQLALVDLVLINTRLRASEIKLRPWEYTNWTVSWKDWQHGFRDLNEKPIQNPFPDEL